MSDLSNIRLLYSAAEIDAQVKRLATAIAADHKGMDNLMIVALLKGSFVFAADLVRALHAEGCNPEIDFMTLSSYGKDTESSGEVTIHSDINDDVKGKHVIIIDDILESGRTLTYASNLLKERGAESAHICVMLEKPNKRAPDIDITPDYVGITVPDEFVIGYGLDHANKYRELPYIGVLES